MERDFDRAGDAGARPSSIYRHARWTMYGYVKHATLLAANLVVSYLDL